MIRQPVKSSNVKAVGYDSLTKDLEVEFMDNAVYVYKKVPENVYVAFMTAPSIGKAVHSMLRDKYQAIRKG